MPISGAFLPYAHATVAMGAAHAVWAGIGAVGAVVRGTVVFHEALGTVQFFVLALIGSGVVGLKIMNPAIGAIIFRNPDLSCLCRH